MFLGEVLEKMNQLTSDNQPVPFTLETRTFNRYNKSGGKYMIHRNAELMRPPKQKGIKRLADPTPFKNPNHFENRTRNIKVNGEIIKINIAFIIRFNGYNVVL